MCSSFSISYGDFGNSRCRLLSIECWLVGMTGVGEGRQNTTVPVRSVFTKTDIDGEHKLREVLGEEVKRLDDGGFRIVCSRASGVLTVSVEVKDKVIMRHTFSIFIGTPNKITPFRPFSTKCFKKPSSLFRPHRF